MMDRNSSMAQLSAWTESQKRGKAQSKPLPPTEDDYEGDGFEDYDDDFEKEETPVKAQPKQASRPIESISLKDAKTSPEMKSSESKSQRQIEEIPDSAAPRQKKFDRISMIVSDPRGIRIKKLLESGVLEMHVEKILQLNIPPSTPYDLYMHNLRSQNGLVKQVGVPADIETRDMEMNTDEIETVEKEVQFCYGDDTDFFTLLNDIKKKNFRLRASERRTVDSEDASGASQLNLFLQRSSYLCETIMKEARSKEAKEEKRSDRALSIFDEGSSWIALGEGKKGANELIRTRRITSVRFSDLQPHLLLTVHPYPVFGEEAEADLLPYKGICSVWDITSPGAPLYVLEHTGQPTCCIASNTQSYLVIGGTVEGTINLWDLREVSALHKNKYLRSLAPLHYQYCRDTVDLKVEKGVRKPCYSTYFSFGRSDPDAAEDAHHTTAIVQIEALDQVALDSSHQVGSTAVSQFVSIDESGLVIFWVTSSPSSSTLASVGSDSTGGDFSRSPWGQILLLQTRSITVSGAIPRPDGLGRESSPINGRRGGASTNGGARSGFDSLVPALPSDRGAMNNAILLQVIPGDSATVLVSESAGNVSKVSRFGDIGSPHVLTRALRPLVLNSDVDSGKDAKRASPQPQRAQSEVTYFSAVTCMDVRQPIAVTAAAPIVAESKDAEAPPSSVLSTASHLVLIGRVDGTVDLFQLDCNFPIMSWSISADANNAKGKATSPAVVKVKWCPHRASVFFAVDGSGTSYAIDILSRKQSGDAMLSEALALQLVRGGGDAFSSSLCSPWSALDLSCTAVGSSIFHMAAVEANKGHQAKIRRMNKQWLLLDQQRRVNHRALQEEESSMRQSLALLSNTRRGTGYAVFEQSL